VPTLFIHIGPGKTGTTFLQKKVLPHISSAETLALPHVQVSSEEIVFGHLFCYSPQIWGDKHDGPFRSLIDTAFNNKHKPESDLIISDEYIYGDVVSPQPWIPNSAWVTNIGTQHGQFVRLYRRTLDIPTLALVRRHLMKLKSLSHDTGFDSLKVLFTTRRQDTKLASTYSQLSNRVRAASQQGFERWARFLVHDPLGYNSGGGYKLNYFKYWSETADVVGRTLETHPHRRLGYYPIGG